jgi:hypothetical protein
MHLSTDTGFARQLVLDAPGTPVKVVEHYEDLLATYGCVSGA